MTGFKLRGGDRLAEAWHVEAVEPAGPRVRVHISDATQDSKVVLTMSAEGQSGPFDVDEIRIGHERTTHDFAGFKQAGEALADRLRALSSGDRIQAFEAFRQGLLEQRQVGSHMQVEGEQWARLRRLETGQVSQLTLDMRALKAPEVEEPIRFAWSQGVQTVNVHVNAQSAPNLVLPKPVTQRRLVLALHTRGELPKALADTLHPDIRLTYVLSLEKGIEDRLPSLLRTVTAHSNRRAVSLLLRLPSFEGSVESFIQASLAFEDVKALLSINVLSTPPPGLSIAVTAEPGIPHCILPPALRPGADHRQRTLTIPGHEEGAYSRACDRCALRGHCPGVRWAHLEALDESTLTPFESNAHRGEGAPTTDWREHLRAALTNRPSTEVELGSFLPAREGVERACVLPWTSLETSPGGVFGPCCANYQAKPQIRRRLDPKVAWHGEVMTAFRTAISEGQAERTCSGECPLLKSGSRRLSKMRLRGGSPAFVTRQLEVVDDILSGETAPKNPPLQLTFSATSFCNYDCVMCYYGENGSLQDEKSEAFYDDLIARLDELSLIEVLGGEPLASPRFRRFLERAPFVQHPQVRIALVTNGSYLSPKQMRRLSHVPFSDLTISINAATAATYTTVNRGLDWARVRANLDSLLALKRDDTAVTYSMVIVRDNVTEIEAFADLAWRDNVSVRFRLPNDNRLNSSIMTDEGLMRQASEALEQVAKEAWSRDTGRSTKDIIGTAQVLRQRLDRGVFSILQ